MCVIRPELLICVVEKKWPTGFHIGMEEGDPGPPNAIEITVRVDDAVATFRRLAESGVNVEGLPRDQPWGMLAMPGSRLRRSTRVGVHVTSFSLL